MCSKKAIKNIVSVATAPVTAPIKSAKAIIKGDVKGALQAASTQLLGNAYNKTVEIGQEIVKPTPEKKGIDVDNAMALENEKKNTPKVGDAMETVTNQVKEQEKAMDEQKDLAKKRFGLKSTILTSPLGVTGKANVGRKTLLGQ